MRNFTRILTVLAVVGAVAPVAANASNSGSSNVGTSMYHPGPRIVHAPVHRQTAASGRSAHTLQMKAIDRNA